MRDNAPTHIEVRGARVHNLKNINVDVPLNELVGIAGVSGSGKSSLALGVLYAEGSRRYMDALSTYTRRRIGQAGKARVDEVAHVPAALALRQRPGIPGIRSTFGTSTELLNHLRLLFSRTGTYICPKCGGRVPPSMNVALEKNLVCPACGEEFMGFGAEQMAFNSEGACPACQGTGVQRTVDEDALVPDETLTIDGGAVKPWGSLMWSLMVDIVRDMGVRTDVPFEQLTDEERDIVFHGPAEKHHLLYHNEKTNVAGEMDFTYYNAVYSVENALSKVKDEKGMKRVERFLTTGPCPDCGGSRLRHEVLTVTVDGINLAQATEKTLDELCQWITRVPSTLPDEVEAMAVAIADKMAEPIMRLQQLGLGYLSLDRASSTLSTGERQRVQLARSVRNRTTGVLYVLDEPSIDLHPSNVDGLVGVVEDLLAGRRRVRVRTGARADEMFTKGAILLATDAIHTVKPLDVAIPRCRLTAVTGVSGSGKTTLMLESLLPAITAHSRNEKIPRHVRSVDPAGIRGANLIDATPIGANVRSTVATYSGVLDDLRRAFAKTNAAKEAGLTMGAFSYNTGKLRCPTCDGTGSIVLDVQFLPDVDIPCPDCSGLRHSNLAWTIRLPVRAQGSKGRESPFPNSWR